mgnify:CR=1 FL=1
MQNVGSAEDIDKGMRLGTNQPMGPLRLADFIGKHYELGGVIHVDVAVFCCVLWPGQGSHRAHKPRARGQLAVPHARLHCFSS